MARQHGKDVRVYLGARDASDDLMSIDLKPMVETHESTTFGLEDKRFDAGLRSWTGEIEAFYQPDSGGIGRQLEAIGDGTAGLGVLSVYDGDADAIGDAGFLGGEAIFTARGQPIKINDLIKLSGSLQGVGRFGLAARLLHVLGAETVTTNGSSHDNAAATSNGGRANIHITSITGTWTITVADSANDSSWATIGTFTAATAAGAQSIEIAGTIRRYTRITATEDSAGTITFVGGLARY